MPAAYATAGLISPVELCAAEPAKSDDWQLPFVKRRYAKLLEILGDKIDGKTINEILRLLGRHCAFTLPLIQQHKGDVEGYISAIKRLFKDKLLMSGLRPPAAERAVNGPHIRKYSSTISK